MNRALLVEVDTEFDRLAATGHSFWEFEEHDRLLWAMACLRHHAGANGFRAILDYDEEAGYGVTAYAIYALRALGLEALSEAAEREWERLRSAASSAGINIPRVHPRLTIDQLAEVQRSLQTSDQEWIAVAEHSDDNHTFVGIADTDFPERVKRWMSEYQTANEPKG